jgi:hypothetical protein
MRCLFACVLLLGGCASTPAVWIRPDGRPVDLAQVEVDRTICRGEVEKAAAQGGSQGTLDRFIGPDRQDKTIYLGCMAQRGYMQANPN